ncbi:hypothetical protein KPH14_004442 [Odynerus spinipes]|uniref:Uncharacterized protein n=1 Tax=Odynerus spinipes TaxID=1348599 RepID=A0AAD9VVF3_9HYME|nr:hypothetical protein KPH14_004442 [Odynerus spinipes]
MISSNSAMLHYRSIIRSDPVSPSFDMNRRKKRQYRPYYRYAVDGMLGWKRIFSKPRVIVYTHWKTETECKRSAR